jgi:hypothetical protein
VFLAIILNRVVFSLSCPYLSVFRVHAPHTQYWFDNNPLCKNVNMSKMRRIPIFFALKLKHTKCSKSSLEIHDFDFRAQTNVISKHFKIFVTLYKVRNYHNISKFQLKTWVFLNIRRILRLKGMVLGKYLTTLLTSKHAVQMHDLGKL